MQIALSALPPDCADVLVLYGDMPLLSAATLTALREHHRSHGAVLTLLSANVQEPFGYGRIVRDEAGLPRKIVEQKELLRSVAAAYGVSHETIRRIMLHVQKQRGQKEA